MKCQIFICLFFSFLLNASLLTAGTIADHPYFKAITGKWEGKGDLLTAEGATISVGETWEGKVNEDGTFSVTGQRKWGDEDQEFKWLFSYNETTELYECEYTFTGLETPMRFEVSVTDNSAELKSPFGEPGGELLINNTIKGNALEGNVLITNGVGLELLKGSVNHTRAKQ